MMTLEQQRIAIAEWSGWTNIEHGEATASPPYDLVGIDSNCVMSHTLMDKHQDNEVKPWKKYVPNYPLDLNAMHEAEKVLTESQGILYRSTLAVLCGGAKSDDGGLFADLGFAVSTTAQRAEAFLRTLKLWKH